MPSKITAVLCLVPLIGTTIAWKSEGHLIVSRIAYEKLQKENPQALAKATNLLQYATQKNPSLNSAEGDYPFVESSTFADTIKFRGGAWQSDWHFVDTPFLDQGDDISQYPDFKFNPENITTAIQGIASWINQDSDYQNNFVYQTMMPKMENDEKYGQSYALRLLIHYLGDIHQPLHCLSRVDQQYPVGDRGGNMFPVPNHYEAKNLHSVWDSVVYEFHVNDKLPYTSETWDKIGSSVQTLMSNNAIKPSEYKNFDVFNWAQDTFEQGNPAYTGVTENEKVPDAYVSKEQPVAERQLVLGGYRLAYLIETLFGSSRVAEEASLFLY